MIDGEALRLSALLCSRLTHDLAGPAGAIANGLELAQQLPDGDASDLIGAASEQLKRRLAFFRRAYGTGQGLDWQEARQITDAYLADGRHQLDWSDDATVDLDPSWPRLVLNMIQCAVEITPSGGTIALQPGAHPAIVALGDIADHPLPPNGAVLEELTPRQIQPVFTAYLAASHNLDLDLDMKEPAHAVWHGRPFA